MDLILQYVLPSILGDFIVGIDKNHMKTNLLSGKVSLEGVTLNPAIVKSLNLPVKIVFSNIGKLEIIIPWLQRLKKPMEIYLEDLFVVLEPNDSSDYFDIVTERVKFLDALLLEIRTKLKKLNADTQKEESSMDYYKMLILDNLQVTIKNIHVRFENTKKGFSFGLTLDEINMRTINENGEPEFMDRTLEENKMRDLFKRLFIKDISLYWNANESSTSFVGTSPCKSDDKRTFLKEMILKNENNQQTSQPILSLSLESHLVLRNINKEVNEDPRYKLEINLQPINIILDNQQINQMISTMNFVTKAEREGKRELKKLLLKTTEDQTESLLFKKNLTEFLLSIEEPDFKLRDELANPKKKAIADQINNHLTRLTNETLSSISREVIIKDEKRRLITKMEKKIVSKGFFGMFKSESQEKKENEEMQKLTDYFDAFVQENERIGQNLMKGFVCEVNLRLSEASLFLLDAKSAEFHGLLLTFSDTRLKLQYHNHQDHDLGRVEFLIKDIRFSIQKDALRQSVHKEITVLTKYDPSSKQDFASLLFEMKKYAAGNNTIDLKGNLQGTELTFLPELVVGAKKFLNFDENQEEDNAIDRAYEKMVDMSKNAQEQFKSVLDEFSSTISISLTWNLFHVVVPLNPNANKNSDCWILAIKDFIIYTDPDSKENSQIIKYDNLKLELGSINVKYIEKVSNYIELKQNSSNQVVENKQIFPLLEDTKIVTELKVLRKMLKRKSEETPAFIVNFNVGNIAVNLNNLFYKKMIELQKCFDFSQEKDLNEILEIEKNKILQNSEGSYTIYFKENEKIHNGWEEYTMINSGFYLYFYKNQTDLEAAKTFFTKKAKLIIDKETYDFPNILKLDNQLEEIVIALETENDLKTLFEAIVNKNQEFHEDDLNVNVELEDLQSVVVVKEENPVNYNHITLRLNVVFEGLSLDIFEQFDTKLNKVSLSHLGIEFLLRDFDQIMKIQLTSISIIDYTIRSADCQEIQILSSCSESQLVNQNDLITIDARFIGERHPDFQKNLNEKEVSLLFNSLSINYIPERIYFLMNFFVSPLSPKAPENNNVRRTSISSNQSNEDAENGHIGTGKQYIAKKADNQKVVKFIVGKVKVNELSLTLFTQISHIKLAKATLKDLSADVTVDKSTLECKGSLKNMQVFDLTNYQQGPEILEIIPYELVGIEKGSSVLEFGFIQRHEGYMKEIQTDVANVLNIDINSIRINYINEPFIRIANYFSNFIVDFNFAETKTEEEKMNEAIQAIRKPKFNSINVNVRNPKVILKAKPNSLVSFELDLDLITVNNQTSKSTERILQKVPSFDYVYTEIYKIVVSDVVLTKKTAEGNDIWLSNSFKLNLDFERCLWENEYILVNQINPDERFLVLDNGFYLNGDSTPIFVKFSQEDYLDIMDSVNHNLAFEDMKESIYHIEPEGASDLKLVTPIDMKLKFEYIAAIAMDQMTHYPLSKAVALTTFIGFKRSLKNDKDVKITINKLIASYYEQQVESNHYIEKTFIGHSYIERESPMKDEDTVNEIFKPEVIDQERKHLESHKDTLINIDYKMHSNQDREMAMNIQQPKCTLNLSVLLRLKDFFNMEDDNANQSQDIQLETGYKFKTHYRGVIEKAEINVPNTENTALIIRSSIIFDMVKYDIIDILKQSKEFLESSQMNVTLQKCEVFVFDEKLLQEDSDALQKRSIVLPLSIMYKSKEHLTFEQSNNKLLAKNDNLCVVDKVVLKMSATDSIVVAAILMRLEKEYQNYQNIPQFNFKSRENSNGSSNINSNLPQILILEEKFKIVHDGIQIRVINDLGGSVTPLWDFSLHSYHDTPAIIFDRQLNILRGKNTFQISSSFFNSKIGKWEPIIEKWEFGLEMEIGEGNGVEIKKKIDITNPSQDVLNINISDEMLKVILLAYRDWNQSFIKYKASSNLGVPQLKISESLYQVSGLIDNQEDNSVEHVSPFTIWNDTGYPLHIEPYLVGTNIKGISCTKKLDIKPGEKQDLIMDWTVERIFEASTKETTLERLKISVWIEHPTYGTIEIPNIDIQNFGIKKRKLEIKQIKQIYPIVCDVFTHKKKKLVRFGSPIMVYNSLPKPIFIQIYAEKEKDPLQFVIDENSSLSLPFDLTFQPISFHMDFVPEDLSQIKPTKIDDLFNAPPPGISLGNTYATVRSEKTSTHAKLHLEPLLTFRNCLPFPLYMRFEGKSRFETKYFEKVLETQEEVSLLDLSHDFRIKMQCQAGEFTTNEYCLLPVNDRAFQNQSLFFTHQNGMVPLNVQIITPENKSWKYLISAKTIVINETEANLDFLAVHDTSVVLSQFKIAAPNGNQMVLFADIPALKILTKNDKSSQVSPIPLNQLGSFPVDVLDPQNQIINLGVHIRNIHCDRQQNIFTKVISVLPRFVILNQTEHIVQFYQPELPNQSILLIPGERSSFNFSQQSQGKIIKIKLNSENGQSEWKESGSLDISSPGNINFVCHNVNNSQEKFFNMVVSLKDASLFVTLQEQNPSDTFIKIKNNTTEYELLIRQQGVSDSYTSLLPSITLPFAWVNPAANNIIVARLASNKCSSPKFECQIGEVNKATTYAVVMGPDMIKMSLRVVLVGRSRVLEFSTQNEELQEKKDNPMDLLFRVNLPALGISLISTASKRTCELLYISLSPFLFALVDQDGSTSVQLRIKTIIFDNNFQYENQFPVVFFAHNAKALKEKDLPHLDFICKVKNKEKASDITYIHKLGFYLAKTCISLDGHTINAIADFARSINNVMKKSIYSEAEYSEYIFLSEKAKKDLEKSYLDKKTACVSWRNIDPALSASDFIYIEKLLIQPIMLNITFKNPQFDVSGAFVFAYIKNALGKALANLDNAPINLSGITVNSLYCTQDQAVEGLLGRYKELAKNSILKIVFSANIIGNPVKFLSKVSSGVNDLVDKPAKGFLEGPIEGGIGIIGGVGSLAAKTLGATFNSLHGITGSLANGLSSLSGDKEYMEKREQSNAKKNTNILTGSVQAVSSVGKGIFGGITGVIEKPIKGAAKGGIGGFLKGAYVGAKGLAIKPVAGVLDGVSKLTEGVSNTLDKDTNFNISKSRIPRVFYGKERIFKNYNFEQTKIVSSLQNIKPQKYPYFTLLDVIFMDLHSNCLILTLERIFLISLQKGMILWKIKSSNIKEVFISPNGIEIILKKTSKSIRDAPIVVIPCKSERQKSEVSALLNILKETVEDSL